MTRRALWSSHDIPRFKELGVVACMQPRHCAPDISRQWANFAESNRGSIVAGKYADLVLLSNDLFRIPKERIRDARVVYTRVGGKQEYRDF